MNKILKQNPIGEVLQEIATAEQEAEIADNGLDNIKLIKYF